MHLYVSLFFLCPTETGIYIHRDDFDKHGVVYALANKFGGISSSRTRIIATRSSDGRGTAKIVLENQSIARRHRQCDKGQEKFMVVCGPNTELFLVLNTLHPEAWVRTQRVFPS